jgi:hypothetical protein
VCKRAIGSRILFVQRYFGVGFAAGMFICDGCPGDLMSRGDKRRLTALGKFGASIDYPEYSLST